MVSALLFVGCGKSQPSSPDAAKGDAPEISILEAVKGGDIETVKQHLAAGTDINEKDNLLGQRPLHQAIADGHAEIAKLLIKSGADVNAIATAVGADAAKIAANAAKIAAVEQRIDAMQELGDD